MAVLDMRRVSICALKKDRKAILETLQVLGVVEPDMIDCGSEGFEKMDTTNSRLIFEKNAKTADSALDVLDIYAPAKKSIFAALEGKEYVGSDRFLQAVKNKEKILSTANLIITKSREIAETKTDILKYENQIEALEPWLDLDIPMNYAGTRETAVLLGMAAPDITKETLDAGIAEADPGIISDIHIISCDSDAVYIAAVCLKRQKAALEEILRTFGFVRSPIITSKKPAVKKQLLEEKISQFKKKITDIENEIKSYSDSREELTFISDYFAMRAEKYEVLGTIPQSAETFVFSGYAPERAIELLEKHIGGKFDCVFEVEDIKENEEAPVILENNSFSSSVEGVVESYGLPRKGEIDPTTIMSFFYVFFFGMMLSDAAYGAIIAIACFVLIKKFPRMSSGMHKSLKMFMWCGVSTLVWGVLFGGYFGDVVDVVSETFFGKTVTIKALWFVPLNDPMKLLIYSMLFGLIHLFTGLGVKGYMMLKDGKVVDFICDVVLWYSFLIGLVLMLVPTDIFASIAQSHIVFPEPVNILAKALTIIGLVGILLMSGRRKKNPLLRLALGAYDIYGVTSWLSDVLSYSRLLALGLATGVIASVVNLMGSMFGGGILGAIGFIIVFILGHTLNLAINLLGAYVHTNRLQFVEFFGKFYEGGGKPFTPFKSNTKYVDIKEEILS